jgi:DNA-binding transcriptional MocR family regulator
VSCAVYLQVAKLYNGTNNGSLAMSGRRLAEAMPISRQTGTRALQELVEKGFLAVATQSAFSLKIKRATEYRLTAYRCDITSQPPSKAFMKWRPEIETRPLLRTPMASSEGQTASNCK